MSDLHRLRSEYQRRAGLNDDRYAWFNPVYQFQMQSRERETLKLIKRCQVTLTGSTKLLEIGCGEGNVLLDFIKWGLKPEHCVGIDLVPSRLAQAHNKLPECLLINANGETLPFHTATFNIITQFTAFSSVLDPAIKGNMAAEMLRVLKPDGAILWYDFWWNPTNPHTAGIKPKEIKQLFPNCNYVFRKITLAPPIARRIVPFSWPLAHILESLKIFNSHYLVLIKKKGD
ncbi:MAG: methyltransferase domain-containing protein [Brevefilum sp.]|nr:methyltransferase domain-containing protein [Brevefilum sp.]